MPEKLSVRDEKIHKLLPTENKKVGALRRISSETRLK